MTGATKGWIVASLAGVLLAAAVGIASAVEVTDNDRTFRNFTRETATVGDRQFRLEVRGLQLQDEENDRLNLVGQLQLPKHSVRSVTGGIIDLLGSYGLGKTGEVGFDITGIIESKRLSNGERINNSDVGDVLLYAKFKRSVAEHCSAGGGVELTVPNGPERKGFSTGELSFNPYVSSRYQKGRVGVGANVGYQIYTGEVRDEFNYGAEVILRGNELYALRAEVAGRVFNQAGQRFHDSVVLPGIDFYLADNIVIRPTGLANLTKTALDWGVGLGIAMTFSAPALALPAAPPPPALAAAPPPAPAPLPTKEKIILRGVNFDFDKSAIRSDARPILDSAAETLKEHGGIGVSVEGHTDSRGSDEYNQRLSVRRAESVRGYLMKQGVDGKRMTTEGYGESKPVASNDTDEGRAQNRRVELLVKP